MTLNKRQFFGDLGQFFSPGQPCIQTCMQISPSNPNACLPSCEAEKGNYERAQAYKAGQTSVAPVAPGRGPAASGVSAGEVLAGIGAILAPLAKAGVGIYAAQLQAKQAKQQLKYGQQEQQYSAPPVYFPPPPQKTSPVLIIGIAVVGLVIVGGMFMMMQGGEASASPGTAVGTSSVAPPRITKVKRVRRGRPRK